MGLFTRNYLKDLRLAVAVLVSRVARGQWGGSAFVKKA
jgi:hypothetical protein